MKNKFMHRLKFSLHFGFSFSSNQLLERKLMFTALIFSSKDILKGYDFAIPTKR